MEDPSSSLGCDLRCWGLPLKGRKSVLLQWGGEISLKLTGESPLRMREGVEILTPLEYGFRVRYEVGVEFEG